MDFTAFDFETANEKRSSACSLGIAVVRDNQIITTEYFFIKPEPLRFSEYNTMIHGITEQDVKEALTFDQLWPKIKPYFEGQIVVAHNASFDVSVLRHSLDQYNISAPAIDILCTYRLSQAVFPNAGSYRLNILCQKLQIDLNHHDAVSDACGCANIMCNFLNENDIPNLGILEKHFNVYHGSLFHDKFGDSYYPCQCKKQKVCPKTNIKDVTVEYCDPDFWEKNFVFTGTLMSMSRDKAFEVVKKGGGTPQKSITMQTNVLVVGIQDISKLNGHTSSSKMRKAYDLQDKGFDIRIIGEDEFVYLIDDDLYNLCF